jgi:hypothetical protein
MPLFVVLRPGVTLDDALVARIKESVRRRTSARYVPTEIFAVTDVPRTAHRQEDGATDQGAPVRVPAREGGEPERDGKPRLARLVRRPGADAQPLMVATSSRLSWSRSGTSRT